jgi:hypothetical protein
MLQLPTWGSNVLPANTICTTDSPLLELLFSLSTLTILSQQLHHWWRIPCSKTNSGVARKYLILGLQNMHWELPSSAIPLTTLFPCPKPPSLTTLSNTSANPMLDLQTPQWLPAFTCNAQTSPLQSHPKSWIGLIRPRIVNLWGA